MFYVNVNSGASKCLSMCVSHSMCKSETLCRLEGRNGGQTAGHSSVSSCALVLFFLKSSMMGSRAGPVGEAAHRFSWIYYFSLLGWSKSRKEGFSWGGAAHAVSTSVRISRCIYFFLHFSVPVFELVGHFQPFFVKQGTSLTGMTSLPVLWKWAVEQRRQALLMSSPREKLIWEFDPY